jgi:hypothetical protein
MPVTAELLQKFTETFGQEIAMELVNWANQVDKLRREDLKELIDQRFEVYEARSAARLEIAMASLRTEMATRISSSRSEMATQISTLRSELIKWIFTLWAGSAVTTIATVWGALNLLRS